MARRSRAQTNPVPGRVDRAFLQQITLSHQMIPVMLPKGSQLSQCQIQDSGREKSLPIQQEPLLPIPILSPPCSSLNPLFPILSCKLHFKPTQMFLSTPKGGSGNSFPSARAAWNPFLFWGEQIPARGAAATQLIQVSPHKAKSLAKQLQAKLSSG